MPKTKRPNKNPAVLAVPRGHVVTEFVREVQSLGNEVVARRAYQKEVGAFLAERGLTADFEAWRAARAKG